MATITGWMAGYFKDQSIKGKTGVLALKRSNEGWAGQLRACIIFGSFVLSGETQCWVEQMVEKEEAKLKITSGSWLGGPSLVP